MKNTCDLHIHTTYSDGTMSPIELLQLAEKRNLKKLSITDHDCVDFYFNQEAMDFISKEKIEYIVGCEFSCIFKNIPIEILGYGLDIHKTKKYLEKHGLTVKRLEKYRSKKIPKVFKKHGITLDYNESSMVDFSLERPDAVLEIFKSVLRNKAAVKLLKTENESLIKNQSLFMRKGVHNPDSKIFVNMRDFYPTAKKILKKIRKFGGICFLAHPYQYGSQMLKILEGLKNDLDGVECYHHSSQEQEKITFLSNFCHKNNLMISGGSDFHFNTHGNEKSHLNEFNIPEKYFDLIKHKLEK